MKLYKNVEQIEKDVDRLEEALEIYNNWEVSYDLNKIEQKLIAGFLAKKRLEKAVKKAKCPEAIESSEEENLTLEQQAQATIDYLKGYKEFFKETHLEFRWDGVYMGGKPFRSKSNDNNEK